MRHMLAVQAALLSAILLLTPSTRSIADEVPAEYRVCVSKGLDWLANQQKRDGHWVAMAGNFPEAMTSLSGVALLMEGSTLRNGKYAPKLRLAVNWLISRSQPNGLIAAPESGNYMYGHGFAMAFLSSVYGEEGDIDLHRKIEDVLTRAVLFSGQAQSVHGGWHYVSAADGGGGDSSATVTQMQGLRAARNVGITVPKEIINKGLDYLRKITDQEGGVAYGWDTGNIRPPLTVAALASSFSAGEYDSDLVKKWIRYCQRHIPLSSAGRIGHDEYLHYYLSQAMYNLGDDRYAKLFPNSSLEQRWTWSKYRKMVFESIMRSQEADGVWRVGTSSIGEVYAASIYLTIMQLDKAVLPIFQR